jgi:uncharacterized coiled-coil protein SlyX
VTCEVQEKTIAKLKSTIARQQRAIEQLATQMQKVSAQVQLNGATAIAANPYLLQPLRCLPRRS